MLDRYKRKSNKNMHILKTCLYKYSKDEQKEVKRYLSSNGRYGNSKVIERLKHDLYQAIINALIERNKARENENIYQPYPASKTSVTHAKRGAYCIMFFPLTERLQD